MCITTSVAVKNVEPKAVISCWWHYLELSCIFMYSIYFKLTNDQTGIISKLTVVNYNKSGDEYLYPLSYYVMNGIAVQSMQLCQSSYLS